MRDFKNYDVWHRSHALATDVFAALRRVRRTEFAGLKAQLRDSADSIPATIVEGCGAATQKEFARFLDMSVKSANETEYHLLVARDRGALPRNDANAFHAEVIEIRRMLCALRRQIRSGA